MPKAKIVTIELIDGVGAKPSLADASLNKGGTPDQVRWWNRTKRGRTLTFSAWPFVEAPVSITVAAGKRSATYTLASTTLPGPYDYSIDPTINPPDGAPDEPAINVGD